MEVPKSLENKTYSADKIVLLLATIEKNGKVAVDFKLMSALSGGTYTHSALEHQFRDIRKVAQDFLNKNPSVSSKNAVPLSTKKHR